MALPVPPSPQTPSQTGGVAVKKEPEIIVIPEKFHGMALKMKAPAEPIAPPPTSPKPVPAPPKPPLPAPMQVRGPSAWPMVLVVLVIVLLVGSVFVYLNRNLLFKQPAPPPVTQPPVVSAPGAPANLTALASGTASVALTWVDASANETGYRLERREDPGTYLTLTNLPANSTAFLDVSVQPGKTYLYRVIAVNEGGESSPSNEATVAVAPSAPPAPVVQLPPSGLDMDSDGLSDVEEPLYGTDPHNPDSDGDGFLDGNEVFHLYNPAAKAPVRLIDSGLVTILSSPAGWSLYVPARWTSTLDVPDGSRATIRTGQGEAFAITLEDNPDHLPLMDWYLARNPGVASSAVRSFTTKGGLEGILGDDRMTAYFLWDGKVFIIRYELNGQNFINYRTTFEMILNSLKLVGAPVVSAGPAESIGGPGALVGSGEATSSATSTTP